ncbi:MAG: hydroxymethylglutaryl-CoA lyase [Rhodospirillales bacterium]|nr:hydroxymethylglutaryl-CoA lyase [Rhodospirillales bacterium]
MPLPTAVVIEEDILRDGLQNEERIFSADEKLAIVRDLEAAGVRRIQVGSFVHPKWVPQMANTDEVFRALERRPGVTYTGLILNAKGLERALACGVGHLSMSVSVSEQHSRRNVNRSVDEALAEMVELIRHAVAAGIAVRAGAQCTFGCVYEGAIPKERVVRALDRMIEAGAQELNLSDTTGMANPVQVRELVAETRARWPHVGVSLHLHDTRGLGLANMVAGCEAGATVFDTAAGGLGGCPFVKGAAGNVPTEDAVNMLQAMGVETGIDVTVLCRAVERLESLLERRLPGRMLRVLAPARSPCAVSA